MYNFFIYIYIFVPIYYTLNYLNIEHVAKHVNQNSKLNRICIIAMAFTM